jgi:protein gp37
MAIRSQIEWTEATWNPTTGCTKVSAGCKNYYAEAMTKRFENKWGKFSEIQFHIDRLSIPSKKKTPTVFFVNSMSDLFHKKIPFFFKQWGGTNKKDSGRLLDGKEYNQMPAATLRKLQKAS